MMGAIRWILPHGLVAAGDWARRFETIGLRPLAAWRAACFGASRRSLVASRLELFPSALVRSLKTIVDVGANEGRASQLHHAVASKFIASHGLVVALHQTGLY